MEQIWKNVATDILAVDMPPPIIEQVSCCTVQEVRRILSHAAQCDAVLAITDAYHAERTRRIFHEEAKNVEYRVQTPQEVLDYYKSIAGHHADSFLKSDVIEAGGPTQLFSEPEIKKERWRSRLHNVSHFLEQIIGKNLEIWLAERMRK